MTEATFKIKISVSPDDEQEQAVKTTIRDDDVSEPIDTSLITGEIVKTIPEQKFTLCVGYPAFKPDVAVAADGFRDWAGADSVEKAAWDYLRKSPKVGLWHERTGTSEGIAEVVESYIYRPDTPWVLEAADGSTQTICKGDWLIGLLWSDEGWDLVQSKSIAGVSPQGRARRRPTDPADKAQLRS